MNPIKLNDLRYDDYSSFCESLDGFLHGTVHVRVGNGKGMGSVPWAASDPIFWLHHCNIDRLWTSWKKGGGVNLATQSFLNSHFAFVGSDGKLADFGVSDGLDTMQLGYEYATLEQRPAQRTEKRLAAQSCGASVDNRLDWTELPLIPGSQKAERPLMSVDRCVSFA